MADADGRPDDIVAALRSGGRRGGRCGAWSGRGAARRGVAWRGRGEGVRSVPL